MPIQLDDAQNHHPLMLTRQQDADKEPLQGEFTLADLQSRFALENGTESEVLAEAAAHGHAFFKRDGLYVGFAPLPGDSEDLPVDPIENGDVASLADHEIFDDAEDPEDAELEVGELDLTIGHPLTAVAAESVADELADYGGDDLPEGLYPEDGTDDSEDGVEF